MRPVKGDRLVFEARESRPGSRWHRVDLEAFQGNGCCGCEHFQIRLYPRAQALTRLPAARRLRVEPVHCKHLTYVVRQWARERLAEISAELRRRHPDRAPSPHNRHD